jgi:hypothetical protein
MATTIGQLAKHGVLCKLASGSSAVAEHSPHHHKFKGLSPTAPDTSWEKMAKKCSIKVENFSGDLKIFDTDLYNLNWLDVGQDVFN